MEEFNAMLIIWLIYAGLAAVPSVPIIFFGRKRIHWRTWELLALVIPFAVWMCLMFSELSTGKSLANLGEPFFFSLAVPAAALARVAVGTRVNEKIFAGILIAALCGVAAAVFFMVPSLPE